MSKRNRALLRTDATNRGWRSFLQGLGIDVVVAVALVLSTFWVGVNGWGDIQWAILSFSVVKSIVQAIAAYVMRLWLDPSRIPTPLPPDPVAEPADDVL